HRIYGRHNPREVRHPRLRGETDRWECRHDTRGEVEQRTENRRMRLAPSRPYLVFGQPGRFGDHLERDRQHALGEVPADRPQVDAVQRDAAPEGEYRVLAVRVELAAHVAVAGHGTAYRVG